MLKKFGGGDAEYATIMSSDLLNNIDDWGSLYTWDVLDAVGHGPEVISSPTSIVSNSGGSEGESESSVISEYDGAGVARREHLGIVCCGAGDDGREISVRSE
jgi:hypothetical protein